MSRLLSPINGEVALAVCTALELDPNLVRRISFNWQPQELAAINVEMFLDESKIKALIKVLEAVEWKESERPTSLIQALKQ